VKSKAVLSATHHITEYNTHSLVPCLRWCLKSRKVYGALGSCGKSQATSSYCISHSIAPVRISDSILLGGYINKQV